MPCTQYPSEAMKHDSDHPSQRRLATGGDRLAVFRREGGRRERAPPARRFQRSRWTAVAQTQQHTQLLLCQGARGAAAGGPAGAAAYLHRRGAAPSAARCAGGTRTRRERARLRKPSGRRRPGRDAALPEQIPFRAQKQARNAHGGSQRTARRGPSLSR